MQNALACSAAGSRHFKVLSRVATVAVHVEHPLVVELSMRMHGQ